MQPAAERLAQAVLKRERVAIFGDYDVDGAASSALLKRFLAHFGLGSEIYIPDRIFEGYGPNPEAMRELVSRGAAADRHRRLRHQQRARRSPRHARRAPTSSCSTITRSAPRFRKACRSSTPTARTISRARATFAPPASSSSPWCRWRSILRERDGIAGPDLLATLDLVALATVCDVVPLTGVNRAFVIKGLQMLRRQENPGLAALARVARIGEPLNTFHLAFLFGPRINAGGRIGDAGLGSRLLATDDSGEAERIAETLDRLNQERQAMEQEMLAEARAEADGELMGGAGPAVMVTASETWHPGIVGLLASRLKEHARRPAFAVAFNANGTGTGSGRSVTGFDLGRLVREAAEKGLIVKGGGHAMAAGITVDRANLGALRAFFEERAAADVFRLRSEESLQVDAALAAEGATQDMLDALEKAGPFGQGYPQPVLVMPHHQLVDVRAVGAGHVRADLRSAVGGRIQAIAFRAAESPLGDFLFKARGTSIHVAGALSGNYWNGARSVQFRIVDAAAA